MFISVGPASRSGTEASPARQRQVYLGLVVSLFGGFGLEVPDLKALWATGRASMRVRALMPPHQLLFEQTLA